MNWKKFIEEWSKSFTYLILILIIGYGIIAFASWSWIGNPFCFLYGLHAEEVCDYFLVRLFGILALTAITFKAWLNSKENYV